jgi:hypothetical protein
MPKTLVARGETTTDQKLAIVQAYRQANKAIGIAKRAYNDGQTEAEKSLASIKINESLTSLRRLCAAALESGFRIWTNTNGKTGHTYEKDYKITPDIDNDFDAMIEARQQHEAAVFASLREEGQAPNSNDDTPDDTPSIGDIDNDIEDSERE